MNRAPVLAEATGQRNHQFDLLRIFFATCVLLSHAPEITDGNPSRELLFRFTHGTATFGSFGVDGFFLLSGYLIVKSWLHDAEPVNFARKRMLRILPGYFVAALLSTALVGYLAPGVDHFFRHLDTHFLKSILVISSPSTPSVLPGQAYPLVNGPLWTISYELRCYALIALCGVFGILRRRSLWIGLTAMFLMTMFLAPMVKSLILPKVLLPILGDPAQSIWLTAIFCIGASFYIFRSKIPFRPVFALAALAIFLLVNRFARSLETPALALCGGYLLFYAGSLHLNWLNWMRRVPDISYGIYLYGWPVECLWIYFHHGSPWVAFAASTLICFAVGWLSWEWVERPMLRLKRRATAPLADDQPLRSASIAYRTS